MGLIDSVIDVFRFKDAIFYKDGSIFKINKMFKKLNDKYLESKKGNGRKGTMIC